MKPILIILTWFAFAGAQAQSKEERTVIERTYLLSHTVFGTKDSLTTEDLFARTATYGHSSGLLQSRSEAVNGIVHNRSTYRDTAVSDMKVFIEGNTAIVRHRFSAVEVTKDGKSVPLNFLMTLVWIRERGKWRLMGRQALKLT